MLAGFKKRFVEYVEEGSKTHTIRDMRKDGIVPRVGETIHCYTGLRQKGARLLGRFRCVKVQEISIELVRLKGWDAPLVTIDGVPLCKDEANELAWRDGFRTHDVARAFADMMEFWEGRLPFAGHLVHWDYGTRSMRAAAKPKRKAVGAR